MGTSVRGSIRAHIISPFQTTGKPENKPFFLTKKQFADSILHSFEKGNPRQPFRKKQKTGCRFL
jgi:hypothetical protein